MNLPVSTLEPTPKTPEIVAITPKAKNPRTLEFKLFLSKDKIELLEFWMQTCRQVWNQGLDLLIEHDTFTGYRFVLLQDEPQVGSNGKRTWQPLLDDKGKKQWRVGPCCPLPTVYIQNSRSGENKDNWQADNLRPVQVFRDREKQRYFCPISQTPDYREPRLGLGALTEYSLQYWFPKKNHPGWQALQDIPAWYVRGTLASLWTAWEHYKKGTYCKPKFKSWRNVADTLLYNNTTDFKQSAIVQPAPGATVNGQPRDGLLYIPGAKSLGPTRVKHLWSKWGNLPINMLKLCRKPDGWYVQLTTSFFPVKEHKPKNNLVALAIPQKGGLLAVAVDASGNVKQWNAAPVDLRLERRIVKLQQSLSRKIAVNKIQRQYFYACEKALEFLFRLHPTEEDLLFVYALTRWQNRLTGKNLAKTKRKLARAHNLIATRRKDHNVKLASLIAQRYGHIVVQEVKFGNLPKPDPVIVPGTFPVQYAANGAEQIADVNKIRSQIAAGQFVAALEKKCAEYGRTFTKLKSDLSPKIFSSDKIALSLFRQASSEVPLGDASQEVNEQRKGRKKRSSNRSK